MQSPKNKYKLADYLEGEMGKAYSTHEKNEIHVQKYSPRKRTEETAWDF
jgi:hypothetical protein